MGISVALCGHICGLGWDRKKSCLFHLLTVSLTAVVRHYSKSAPGLEFDQWGGIVLAWVGLGENR